MLYFQDNAQMLQDIKRMLNKLAQLLLLDQQTKEHIFSAILEQVLTSHTPLLRSRHGFNSKLNHEERSHHILSGNETLNLVSWLSSFLKQKISQ